MVLGQIGGRVEPGYEPVADAFERLFTERAEHGAAFAAVVGGRAVVDLWGGIANAETGEPWREETAAVIFSGTKGVVGAALLLLVERGQLDLDAPVQRTWPEFRDGRVLVRHVVSHTAGLPAVRGPLAVDDLLDDEAVARRLATQEPLFDPGTTIAYHAFTFGTLCAQLVRRVDGRTIGHFVADEIATPLGLDLWLGLPASLEPRVARLHRAPDYRPGGNGDAALVSLVYDNPPLLTGERFPWNERAFHAAEIAGAGAIATARSLARLYGSLDRLPDELSRGIDAVSGEEAAFGVGFALQTQTMPFGPVADGFGHGGAGGSLHGAWPSRRTGFSYVMNELRSGETDDRAARLLAALARATSV